ncbi:MAG TPA: zinc-ribbon domain-containing protein [Candidatus Eisenbacteria bacterium]|nr:zinc-ribbon domain-containing protein [Candidatus Eisenbacteria bacterium]
MTFECTSCHMRYRIDDSILPRGGARVRCRQCSTMILIPAPAVIPPPAMDLIPPPQPPRARPAPPPAPPAAVSAAPVPPPGTPANAPDWLLVDIHPEAPAREAEPPIASEPVGGMAVVGESLGPDSLGLERFTQAAPPPSTGRDPAFEDIGMSVARFETGPAQMAPQPEPVAPSIPRLEVETVARPVSAPQPPYTQPAPPPASYAQPAPPPYAAPAPPPPPAPAAETPRPSYTQPPAAAPAPAPPAAPAPAAPVAPQAPPSRSVPADVIAAPGNVVPLTLGTPIPDGLPPDERARHEKARRLARVLASDIAIYNREKKDRGMQEGNLVAVLGYEIKKSWETYKERVGADFANSTPYFRDALNDMLAEGKKVF